MKKFKLHILQIAILLSFILFIYSCKNRKTNQNDTINPPVLQNTTKIIDLSPTWVPMITNISDIASSITYVPLETSENSKLAAISEIVVCDNNMYISTLKDVFCFDHNGQFHYKLSLSYMNFKESDAIIYDFDISSDEKILAILSDNKILEFLINGKEFHFWKTIDLKQPFPSKFAFVPGTSNMLLSIIPSRGYESTLNILINVNGDTLIFKPNCYRYGRRDKLPYGSVDEIIQYKIENGLCFKEEFSDTIFCFNNKSNEYKPKLILYSHGNTLRPWMRGDGNFIPMYDSIYNVQNIFESSRYLLYSYTISSVSSYNIIYDKSLDKKFGIKNRGGLKDDITGGPDLHFNLCSGSELYYWINAAALKNYVERSDFLNSEDSSNLKKEKLIEITSKLKSTDNPVIIVITLKE